MRERGFSLIEALLVLGLSLLVFPAALASSTAGGQGTLSPGIALPERRGSPWRGRPGSAPEAGSAWPTRRKRSDSPSQDSKATQSYFPNPSKAPTRGRTPG